MPVIKKQNGQFEQICQGWIMVLKLPDTDENNTRNQDTEELEESQGGADPSKQIAALEDEEKNLGEKYYAILYTDRLKLFEDEDMAYRHINKQGEDWEIKPKEEHMIYRMSKTGLISDSYRNQSFTMMVQDNVCKMQTLKLKITILNDQG